MRFYKGVMILKIKIDAKYTFKLMLCDY